MKIVRSVNEMRECADTARADGRQIGCVPTMGALHDGHLSLVRKAKALSDFVVVTIFVNPTQFAPGEDLDRYPRDEARDAALCEQEGVDVVFCPPPEEMYAPDHSVYVDEDRLSNVLCGASRPGHFRGVATVVCKLFNVVTPDVAVFGMKDAQQARVVQRMVSDLNFDVAVVLAPTMREEDGLALSSRNAYLDAAQRHDAVLLYESLCEAERVYREGEAGAHAIRAAMDAILRRSDAVQVEYVAIVDFSTLDPVATVVPGTLVAVAAQLGATRLIDNVLLD